MSNNTAILLYGLLPRSINYTFDSFKKYIVSPLLNLGDVDIYYHSWFVETINNPRTNEIDIPISFEDLKNYLPDAIGKIEDQKIFDLSFDWTEYIDNNPLNDGVIKNRGIGDNDIKSEITLLNFFRSLESQRQVFNIFKNVNKNYNRIIISRPDLKFLNKIIVSDEPIKSNEIIIPNFHHWGGINDKFAIGSINSIEHYCSRIKDAHHWAKFGKGNTEMFLMEYMRKNHINVSLNESIKFYCIRSTGEMDYESLNYGLV